MQFKEITVEIFNKFCYTKTKVRAQAARMRADGHCPGSFIAEKGRQRLSEERFIDFYFVFPWAYKIALNP